MQIDCEKRERGGRDWTESSIKVQQNHLNIPASMNHVSILLFIASMCSLGMPWKFIYIYFDLDFEKNKGDHHVTRWLRWLGSFFEEERVHDAVTSRILGETFICQGKARIGQVAYSGSNKMRI